MKASILVPGLILIRIVAFAQGAHSNANNFIAGYKNISLIDSSRVYKLNTKQTDPLHYRPLEIDIWYPAMLKESPPMKYLEFLDLLQERSNRFQNDTVYKSLTSELIRYLNLNLEISDSLKISKLQTHSYKEAEPVDKPFPLVIYQCAYNGMSYENVPLFEKLASQGFVVACITSVGRYPGNMTTRPEDLAEQVKDGEFVKNYLERSKNIDSAKIGSLGYSWGGLASLIMAIDDKDISAVFSLDGSEMFYYRGSDKENDDFNSLRKSSNINPENLEAPYAYLESGYKQADGPADSIYSILPKLKREAKFLHFASARHEDFSVIPSLGLASQKGFLQCSSFYDTIISCATDFFTQYLKKENKSFAELFQRLIETHQADSVRPDKPISKQVTFLVAGRIIDAKTRKPIAYVNVGIPGKNAGTVSRLDGSFEISASVDDTIQFSMIGYEWQQYAAAGQHGGQLKPVIEMAPKTNALEAVTITGKMLPTRRLGNTTTSHFFNIGLPLKFLGSELGIIIHPGKSPVILKSFRFNISENHMDSAVFRLNIYSLKNGHPFENILSNNILLHVGNQAVLYTLDLREYKIILKKDVLISLEWIDGGKSGNERGVLFLSAALLNSSTWHRTTSMAKWSKAKGLGAGFNVEVQSLKQNQEH